ncbi:hypothetical protein [Streptomyces sp. NBC_01373]|uniref:hypothetical protein n=1 Tax=Streptomyces sp. NBC_01373 TaxID=2903843 RepID=UPI0022565B30|nr:hypothetical protein [Streptomyces sp. NBC_01373]MCX4703883.1 hypothetical protein [Streptomyces sp. NBC_01373]
MIAAIIGTGVVVVNSRDDDGSPAAAETSTLVEDTVTAAEEEPSPTPEDTGPEVFGLSDAVVYDSGVEVSLSKFERATSSDYASPGNTPYVRFTVKLKNGSSATVDTTLLSVSCSYGVEGQGSESIFDDGLDGSPTTKLLTGRSLSVAWGCELPKGEEVLQVEVTPDFESETAIFTGKVK